MLNSSRNASQSPEYSSHPFGGLGLHPDLLARIPANWIAPKPIQQKAVPLIVKGRDVIALAATGSGKTAAFALPIINELINKPSPYVKALVLNPVRELAAQTHAVFQELSQKTDVSCALFRGGTNREHDVSYLSWNKPNVVVGTLGRLASLVQDRKLDLSRVETLVIDEADRMLGDFNTREFLQIVERIPRSRQTLLFSATMPPHLEAPAEQFMRRPTTINIGANRPPTTIHFEEYEVSRHHEKLALFVNLIKSRGIDSGLIFMNRKNEIDVVERLLRNMNYDARALHHGRDQRYCEETLAKFKNGEFKFLLASDALQRGIDIQGLPLVVNYDFPRSYEDFTHRSGRTGRQEQSGLVVSFLTYGDRRCLAQGSGSYRGYQKNLDSNCEITRPQLPNIRNTFSAAEIDHITSACRNAWGAGSREGDFF